MLSLAAHFLPDELVRSTTWAHWFPEAASVYYNRWKNDPLICRPSPQLLHKVVPGALVHGLPLQSSLTCTMTSLQGTWDKMSLHASCFETDHSRTILTLRERGN